MSIAAGIFGFVGGFCLGLFMINLALKGKSREDLLNNRAYRWTYGLGVWIFAAFGAYATYRAYIAYFQ